MSRRLKILSIIAGCLLVFAPVWVWGILPRITPDVACVIRQPDGTPVKAWGKADCINNGMPTIVLRRK
jgi:hypothetical protein